MMKEKTTTCPCCCDAQRKCCNFDNQRKKYMTIYAIGMLIALGLLVYSALELIVIPAIRYRSENVLAFGQFQEQSGQYQFHAVLVSRIEESTNMVARTDLHSLQFFQHNHTGTVWFTYQISTPTGGYDQVIHFRGWMDKENAGTSLAHNVMRFMDCQLSNHSIPPFASSLQWVNQSAGYSPERLQFVHDLQRKLGKDVFGMSNYSRLEMTNWYVDVNDTVNWREHEPWKPILPFLDRSLACRNGSVQFSGGTNNNKTPISNQNKDQSKTKTKRFTTLNSGNSKNEEGECARDLEEVYLHFNESQDIWKCRDGPVVLLLHGASWMYINSGNWSHQFSDTDPSIGESVERDRVWGSLLDILRPFASEIITNRHDTVHYGWNDPFLQRAYYNKAHQVFKQQGGLVFAHSMASLVLAGACAQQGLCDVKWHSVAAPIRGARAPASAYKIDGLPVDFENEALRTMRPWFLGLSAGYLARVVHDKHLFAGCACGISSYGSGGPAGMSFNALTKMATGKFPGHVLTDGAVFFSECGLFKDETDDCAYPTDLVVSVDSEDSEDIQLPVRTITSFYDLVDQPILLPIPFTDGDGDDDVDSYLLGPFVTDTQSPWSVLNANHNDLQGTIFDPLHQRQVYEWYIFQITHHYDHHHDHHDDISSTGPPGTTSGLGAPPPSPCDKLHQDANALARNSEEWQALLKFARAGGCNTSGW